MLLLATTGGTAMVPEPQAASGGIQKTNFFQLKKVAYLRRKYPINHLYQGRSRRGRFEITHRDGELLQRGSTPEERQLGISGWIYGGIGLTAILSSAPTALGMFVLAQFTGFSLNDVLRNAGLGPYMDMAQEAAEWAYEGAKRFFNFMYNLPDDAKREWDKLNRAFNSGGIGGAIASLAASAGGALGALAGLRGSFEQIMAILIVVVIGWLLIGRSSVA
jgi:hypothetical protein